MKLHLQLTVNPNGAAHVAGVISEADRLVAHAGEPAQASCADTDSDGVAGLTSVEFSAQTTQTRDHVGVAVVPIGRDIDQSGTYQLAVTIGGRTTTVEADVAYGETRQTSRG